MKKFIVTSFTVLVLLLSLANCGKSGGGGSTTTPNTYYPPYNPNTTDPYGYYNNQYQNMYGGNQNYCYNYAQGCVQCQVPQCQYSGCGWGTVYYAQPGYYNQNLGYYGQGGANYVSFSAGW